MLREDIEAEQFLPEARRPSTRTTGTQPAIEESALSFHGD